MHILIAGASGFIGQALTKHLLQRHNITVLGRNKALLKQRFDGHVAQVTWDELNSLDAHDIDVVINLCGYTIAQKRWSPAVKKELIDSRVIPNQQLISWLISQEAKPHYISANAIGIYGLQEDGDLRSFDEDSAISRAHPQDFLSEIGIAWEHSLQAALNYDIPVTTARFGVVLKRGKAMLQKLELPFNLGLGSTIGTGQQYLSWVHLDDVTEALSYLIDNPNITGPVNITAPNPVSQKEFAQILAKTMGRPLFLNMPAFMVKLIFGEMGECLLLKGQRVIPKRLSESGYVFKYPTLKETLVREYR